MTGFPGLVGALAGDLDPDGRSPVSGRPEI
jgi:hypothetical protein